MTRIILALSLFLSTAFVANVMSAVLPQEQFLQIYLLIQEGEKLESANQKASARSLFKVSEERLEKLNLNYPEWEPTIVKYRLRYSKDKLESLKDAVDADLNKPAPIIPPEITQGEVTDSITATAAGTRPSSPSEIMEAAAPTGMAPVIEVSGGDSSPTTEDPAALKQRIRTLELTLADTEEKLTKASTEAAVLRARVGELEKALTVAREGTSDEKLSNLMVENNSLKEKLSKAESTIASVQSGPGGQSIVALDEQVKKIQDQLNLSRQENEALRQTSEEFKAKLQEAQKQLDEANIKIAGLPKEDPIRKENEMMRDLIRREQAEFERRKIASRIALEELQALKIDSEKLKTQITLLASPLIILSDDEKALLRQPSAGLQVDSSGNISAPATSTVPDAAEISSRPKVPEEFRDAAREANDLFAAQKFDEAAARYQTILNVHPDSLYALSNIAVVRFQQGKYPLAEDYLRKAVKLSPQDAFSHSILGIVLYQQGKIDDAVQILTRAVALDPNDPKTRNYLGIAASQKGWQEAAEQECRKAIELDPLYGDAHFNLSVIYATQKPPARELASRHYKRALELGIPRDPELEKMLK